MNVKIIKKCTVIGIILFFMFILLTGCSKEEKKSNLIGMWDSDWQPVVDRNIYIFNEDGTGENIFILGAAVTNNEIEQKYRWLEKYYPNIRKEHIFFINSTSLKPEVILECCKHYNISVNDVAFVDDRLDALRKAESLGIKSYHPSSFTE